nr:MAG TPA: hypothetical protein [Bacteriophage sp.]
MWLQYRMWLLMKEEYEDFDFLIVILLYMALLEKT